MENKNPPKPGGRSKFRGKRRMSRIEYLLKKQSQERGETNEIKGGKVLELMKNYGEITFFRKSTPRENKSGKDWIFEFLLPDGSKAEGWFDVKSSRRGVTEHREKNFSFSSASSAPKIKKIRPTLLVESADTLEMLLEKARKIKEVFSRMYEEYLPEGGNKNET